jgi:uncharacterized protein (DUF362 family)
MFNMFQRKFQGGDVFVSFGNDGYSITKQILGKIPFDFTSLRGKRVLVKPNAGRFVSPDIGINTGPSVVAAVLDFLVENGADNVFVGESPILGVKALEALEKSGISEVVRKRGVDLVDLDAVKPEIIPVPDPRVVKSLKICREVLDSDFIISVPVMKTHMHTQVSLGLKNMKGCLYKREKVRLHQQPPVENLPPPAKPLDLAIADLAKLLMPDLVVTDGIIGQEGMGPSAGSPKAFGAIVASMNCLAADSVTAELMGLDPSLVYHLELAQNEVVRTGVYGDFSPGEYKVFPPDYKKHSVEFQKPPEKISFEFENVLVEDEDSCSACLSTVLMFLKRYHSSFADYFGEENPLRLALGKAIGPQEAGALLIGNCTAKRKEGCIFVKGCPPVASDILKALENLRELNDIEFSKQ